MLPSYSELAGHWSLQEDLVYLNHGSFGATPTAIQQLRSELQKRMEADPMHFFVHDIWDLKAEARVAVSEFAGADPQGLVFGENATSLVNAVLRSLQLEPGDEIVVLDHGYGACINAAKEVCQRAGATMVMVELPFPIDSPEQVTAAIVAGVSDRTVLAIVDHVTSPTALVLPVEKIVAALNHRGVDVVVDGAHAPGMLPLTLDDLGAAYYVGNLHKWVCGPKSAAFLSIRSDKRLTQRPLVVSHGATSSDPSRSKLLLEFDWQGTSDPTAIACVGETIVHIAQMVPGGWPEIQRRNNQLAGSASKLISDALGTSLPAPESMFGSMGLIPLPGGLPDDCEWPQIQPLQALLEQKYSMPLPIVAWPTLNTRFVRVSAHLYNTIEQFEYLAQALVKELS